MDMRRRRQVARRGRREIVRVLQGPPEIHLQLHGAIRKEHECPDQDQEGAGKSGVAQPFDWTERPTERRAPRHEQSRREREEHAAVPTGQCLQAKERAGPPQVASLAEVQIRVQECQTKRNPLNRGEVKLADAEEPWRREGENQAGEHRAGRGEPDAPSQEVCADATEYDRQKRRGVHREEEIARHPQERRRDQRVAELVLRIRQRVRERVEDVGVEECEGLMHETRADPIPASRGSTPYRRRAQTWCWQDES